MIDKDLTTTISLLPLWILFYKKVSVLETAPTTTDFGVDVDNKIL